MSEFQLDKEVSEKRSNDFAIQPLFLNRWSPRSFLGKSVPEEELVAVLEAAHWAPSCMNEQPWRFIVAKSKQALTKMQACLVPGNQIWANRAPVLLAIISRPTYIKTNQPNGWHSFDAGAAWVSLALEAKARGMIAHAMAGFDRKKLCQDFNIPDDWGVHAVMALGYQGPADQLSKELQDREYPSERKPVNDIWREDLFDFI